MKQMHLILPSLLALSACAPGSGGGDAKSPARSEMAETSVSKNFEGNFLVLSAESLEFQSRSLYSPSLEGSLLRCSETADGRDFRFEMKNGAPHADDLKIQIRNAYFRPEKQVYKDLSSVRFDGFSRNQWFRFDGVQAGLPCEASVERVQDYVKGFFQCTSLSPSNTTKRIAVVLNFSCDVVRK